MSNFERDVANAMLDKADERIRDLEAELSDCQQCLSETCQALAVEHTAVENLEAQLGQWRQRGSIVGVIIRDDEGKDWKWDGQDWAAVSELETELVISKGREEGKQLVIDQLEATLKEAELQRAWHTTNGNDRRNYL